MLSHAIAAAALATVIAASSPPLAAAEQPGEGSVQATLPDDARGRCVREFIEYLNAPTPEALARFEQVHASTQRRESAGRSDADRLASTQRLNREWGTATLERVDAIGDSAITARVATARGGPATLEFRFSATERGKLDAIVITREADPGSGTVSVDSRTTVVEHAASILARQYVYPEVGRRMAELIRRNLDGGEYDRIDREAELARRLTDDLRSISSDKHLRIRVEPDARTSGAPDDPTGGPGPAPAPRVFSPGGENFGFKRVEILDGNVGYIRLDGFADGDDAKQVAAAAMALVARSGAIVFDLRHNGGGSPEMVRFISSYLFDARTHLNDMLDRNGRKIAEYWTLDDPPGRRLGTSVPVYVLTSGFTFSGAEEFAYNLKNLKRATIVGETTGGGAHPVRRVRIDDRFVMSVPFMRACNPITGTNWEGVGVEPDLRCAADQALEAALAHARDQRR